MGVGGGWLDSYVVPNELERDVIGSQCFGDPSGYFSKNRDQNSSSSFSKTHPPLALAKGNCLKSFLIYSPLPKKALKVLAYFKT